MIQPHEVRMSHGTANPMHPKENPHNYAVIGRSCHLIPLFLRTPPAGAEYWTGPSKLLKSTARLSEHLQLLPLTRSQHLEDSGRSATLLCKNPRLSLQAKRTRGNRSHKLILLTNVNDSRHPCRRPMKGDASHSLRTQLHGQRVERPGTWYLSSKQVLPLCFWFVSRTGLSAIRNFQRVPGI